MGCTPLRFAVVTVMAALAVRASAAEIRSDQAVAEMLRGGLVKVSSAQHRKLQPDLERATRFVLRHRLDCEVFSEADYAPAASAAARAPVFRVTCEVRSVRGGYANFFVRKDEIGKVPAPIRRDPS